uniref:Uncharacterized protein n=1 Tax=Strongyloides venezuelensis TaxID=75913 RepID=A0A0K0FJR2_STRVS
MVANHVIFIVYIIIGHHKKLFDGQSETIHGIQPSLKVKLSPIGDNVLNFWESKRLSLIGDNVKRKQDIVTYK